jgi:hypothetical protein
VRGEIYYPPRLDESGDDVRDGTLVMTGTTDAGKSFADPASFATGPSGDWTSNSANCIMGDAFGTTYRWTVADNPRLCDRTPLYCFGVDHATALPIPPTNGRLAFVSHNPFLVGGGVTPDTFCNDEAQRTPWVADHPGPYRALLATSTSPAIAAFSDGLPWIRGDRVPWVLSRADLARGSVLTSLNVDSVGAYQGNFPVWTGANDPASPATADCATWTSTQPTQGPTTAMTGNSTYSGVSFFQSYSQPCSASGNHLYCLQVGTP